MLPCFSAGPPSRATALHLVSRGDFDGWRQRHSEHDSWLAHCAWRADPGSFVFLPAAGDEPPSVLASAADGEPTWALGGLPLALPEGLYAVAGDSPLAGEARLVTLVGKGVCFDTGGLHIKGHDGMQEMKKDMAGAAIVLGLAQALMASGAPLRLRVLIPAVDNAIAGDAMRPRDVVRTRSGKTVEIGFTDAEGRLVLCDALSEACGEQPALVIDVATLTGSAKATLGSEVQALFCDDDALAASLVHESFEVGDPVWRLPLWRPYRKRLDSPIADFGNVAKGLFADAIVAALYLQEFVPRSQPWMHLDVMGPNPLPRPGRPEGGEATGLLALYRLLRRRWAAAGAPS